MDAIKAAKMFLEETKPPPRDGTDWMRYVVGVNPQVHNARAVIAALIPIAESSLLSMEARVKAARDGPVYLKSLGRSVQTYGNMALRYSNPGGLPSLKVLSSRLGMAAIHLAHATGVSLESVLRQAVQLYEGASCQPLFPGVKSSDTPSERV